MNRQNNQKFRNKYRIPSMRLAGYDYSQNGAYFVTICTKNREHYLGEIIDGKMQLSEIGKIAKYEWEKTSEIRKYIELGEWVIMPNHLHGIFIINNENNVARGRDVLTKRLYEYNGDHPQMSKISPIQNSISTAIRFFKRQTAIESKKINPDFAWQPRFHDHIVRNESEYRRIAEYIHNNPMNWENDSYF